MSRLRSSRVDFSLVGTCFVVLFEGDQEVEVLAVLRDLGTARDLALAEAEARCWPTPVEGQQELQNLDKDERIWIEEALLAQEEEG